MASNIKVLNVNYDSSEFGGVAIFLLNVFRNIDHTKIQFDFLTPDKTSYNIWREEIEHDGGSIFEFHINSFSWMGKLKFRRRFLVFLKSHSYDIVHLNSGSVSFNCITAVAAKSMGMKVIIHSHNSGGRKKWKAPIIYLMKLRMQRKADVLCACSTEAARNIFTSRKVDRGEIVIINNGIDLKKFQFNSIIRSKVRQELKINDRFVVGHVGRFAEQKNHGFLIDIFAEVLREKPNAVLLLIGKGELEDYIREKVCNLNMENNVLFLGQRNDVEDLYQAMDVFLFPSLFEGLPISLVEAQVSGLPCCISDTISTEVDLTPLVHRLSLENPVDLWAQDVILSASEIVQRRSWDDVLRKAGYGIDATALKISEMYEELIEK